jgi:hypothetical protein
MVSVNAALQVGCLFVQAQLTGKETGDKMLISNFPEFRFSMTANVSGKQTARVKATTRRRIDGAGDVAF